MADADTGLVRFGFRDYDPAAGKWTAKDPIFFSSGQANLYAYCGNDPVGFKDRDGMLPRDDINQFDKIANEFKINRATFSDWLHEYKNWAGISNNSKDYNQLRELANTETHMVMTDANLKEEIKLGAENDYLEF